MDATKVLLNFIKKRLPRVTPLTVEEVQLKKKIEDVTITEYEKDDLRLANNLLTKSRVTFFEFAYTRKAFAYCDECMEFWRSDVSHKEKQNQEFLDNLSKVTQPPLNTVIQEPVYCMYESERAFDTSKFYEKEYLENIIKANSTNCEIEEPNFASEMSFEEFENLRTGQEIITQIDTYDVVLMNTKIMTSLQLHSLIHDGQFRDSHTSLKSLFPIRNLRRRHDGIHFIQDVTLGHTHPLLCFNFERFENYLFYQVLGNTLWKEKDFDELVQVHDTIRYLECDIDQGISFGFQFEEKNDVYSCNFVIPDRSLHEGTKMSDPAIMFCKVVKEGCDEKLFASAFQILLFINGRDNPMTLTSTSVQEDYVHEAERIVKRGVVKGKGIGHGNKFYVDVKEDNEDYVLNNETMTFHHTTSMIRKVEMQMMLANARRACIFEDKSYALNTIRIGLFTIPTTVYLPNCLRLANGKKPKKFKAANDYKSKKNKTLNFLSLLCKIYTLSKDIKMVVENPLAEAPKGYETIEQCVEHILPFLKEKQLLQFHDEINRVDFQLRNKFIMSLRGNKELPFTFNQIYSCIMNRTMCEKLMDNKKPWEKWCSYFDGKGDMPTLESIEVAFEDLPLTPYIKNKLKQKTKVDTMTISPLVLGILLKKEIKKEVLEHGNFIQNSDTQWYPLHFVLHFCDSAKLRQEYTELLINHEVRDGKDLEIELVRIMSCWQTKGCEDFIIALFEWPFDNLLQAFFLLHMKIYRKILADRFWRTTMVQIFMHVPGFSIVENLMQSYGYPEHYEASWRKGIFWFYDLGFNQDPFFVSYVRSVSMNRTNICIDKNKFELIKSFHDEYRDNQFEECDALIRRMESHEADFRNIFCDKDVNIFFGTNPLLKRRSVFSFMVENPKLWNSNDFVHVSKIMMHYLSLCPALPAPFQGVAGIYIDLRLSMFATVRTLSVTRRRNLRLPLLTVLVRNGGSERQIHFMCNLITPVSSKLLQFTKRDLHDMLHHKMTLGILKSPTIASRFAPSSQSFYTNNIELLFTSDEFFFDLLKDEGSSMLRHRVKLAKEYIDVVNKNSNFDNTSHTISDSFFTDEITSTRSQQHYVKIIRDLISLFHGIVYKMDLFASKHKVNMVKPFLKIVMCNVWSENYIKDVMRFEHHLVAQSPLKTPTLYAYASCKLGDLGTWWPNWLQRLQEQQEQGKEMIRLFHLIGSQRNFPIENKNMIIRVVDFVFEYILPVLPNVMQMSYLKVNSINVHSNYDHFPQIILQALTSAKDSLAPSVFSRRAHDLFTERLDQIFCRVITLTHSDTTMDPINQGQNMFFLKCFSKSKPECLFNDVLYRLLTLKLDKSLLLFLESVEKHFDFGYMKQDKEHVFKTASHHLWDIEAYMSYFQLDRTNRNALIDLVSEEKPEKYWLKIAVKCLFCGLVDWQSFSFCCTNETIIALYDNHNILYKKVVEDKLDEVTFTSNDRYSMTYFLQRGVNPICFNNMTCTDRPSLSWMEHILKSLNCQGWPMKMYPCVALTCNLQNLHFLDHFALNENQKGMTYNETFGEAPLSEYFVLDHHSLVAKTLLQFDYSYFMSMKTKDAFFTVLDEQERCNFWSMKHGCVSSTADEYDVEECKIDFIGFLILKCRDLTAPKLRQLYDQFDTDYERVHGRFDDLADWEQSRKVFFFNRRVVDSLTSHLELMLKFSDKVRLFKVVFERLERICEKLGLPLHTLFRSNMLNVKTGHRVVRQPVETTYFSYNRMDVLTFCAYYGRPALLKYLLRKLQDYTKNGYKLENIRERASNNSLNANNVHSVLYSNASITDNPYEHLLYACIVKGNIKCFCHVFNVIKREQYEDIDWRKLMVACVHLVKFDATKYEQMKSLLERKRKILEKMFKSQKLKAVAHNLANGVDKCIQYLTCFPRTLSKVNDFFAFYKPHFKSRSKVILRSELMIWGRHICECFTIFESYTDEIYEFRSPTVLNMILFYSIPLFDYCIKRCNFRKISDNATVYMDFFIEKNIISKKEADMIRTFFTDDRVQGLKTVVLLHLLKMEKNNTNLAFTEIMGSTFLSYVLCNFINHKFRILIHALTILVGLESYEGLMEILQEYLHREENDSEASSLTSDETLVNI